MDVVDFLLARISEDAEKSRELLRRPFLSEAERWYERRLLKESEAKHAVVEIISAARQAALANMLRLDRLTADLDHHAGHDESAAGLQWTSLVLGALALPYAEHPDYQASWTDF